MKIILLTCIFGLVLVWAAETPKAKKLKQKASETAEASKEFVVETKDLFVSKAKEEMNDLDKEIDELKVKANHATSQTRDSLNSQIQKLEVKRKEVEAELDRISNSTGKAWGKMKSGFQNAWSELKAAVKKASNEFK